MSDLNVVNILVTVDKNYLPYLNTMLSTLVRFNHGCVFDVYLLHASIEQGALEPSERVLGNAGRLIPIEVCDWRLEDAPTTSRYPKEIYYRIFAARYLPDTLDRVLYLDPDLVVNGSITPLFQIHLVKRSNRSIDD